MDEIEISKPIKSVSTLAMRISRIFGLFPFTVHERHSRVVLRFSTKYTVYSFIISGLLIFFTVAGISKEFSTGTEAIKMYKPTNRYVTVANIVVIVTIVISGIFGTPLRRGDFFAYLDCLRTVDSVLVVSDLKEARKATIVRTAVIFGCTTIVVLLQLTLWMAAEEGSDQRAFHPENYVAYYLSYYVVIALEYQYWQLISGIQRRLKLIANCLDVSEDEARTKTQARHVHTVFLSNAKQQAVPTKEKFKHFSENEAKNRFIIANSKKLRNVTEDNYVMSLMQCYTYLWEAGRHVNKCCGFIVLITFLSCLLHLIANPYFLLQEIWSQKSLSITTTLRAVWIATHISRLVILTEACHSCRLQEVNVNKQICKLLYVDFDEKFSKQLKLFASELQYRHITYTACDLFVIDRAKLTTIAGAITTYLAILLQFQQNEANPIKLAKN